MDQTNAVKRTGMIGLGAMGLQFARHMQRKGFDVAGYDINADAVRRAENDGIKHRGSPAEVGKFAEVVVVMVATDEQVESVVEGSGLLDALAPGSVICIASSVAPETCRRLAALAAAKNIGVLDTPVVLGQEAADNGTCTVYVGGEERWFLRARPVLQTFGRDIMHLGDVGSGQIAKMINNMLLWATMVANFESLTLAKQLGMDIPKLAAALGHGSRRQLVAVALGQEHRQMGREGYGYGAGTGAGREGADAARRLGRSIGQGDQPGEDEGAAVVALTLRTLMEGRIILRLKIRSCCGSA